METRMLTKSAVLAMALKGSKGELLSEKVSTLNIPDVAAIKSNRGFEVIIFTDKQSCTDYGGFLAGEKIISPSGKKGTIKGAGFYGGDFRHGMCDPSGYTVWIDFDEEGVKCVGGRNACFDLRKEGYVLAN